jgi:hypothetical protein
MIVQTVPVNIAYAQWTDKKWRFYQLLCSQQASPSPMLRDVRSPITAMGMVLVLCRRPHAHALQVGVLRPTLPPSKIQIVQQVGSIICARLQCQFTFTYPFPFMCNIMIGACPSGLAWSDVATDTNTAHAPAECSGRGLCDTATGECSCFDGFTGDACQRTVCPNECSGHGRCMSMKQLAQQEDALPLVNTTFLYTGKEVYMWYCVLFFDGSPNY